MSASFYDLMKYARTGIASPEMTGFDKVRALSSFPSDYPLTTLTGIPPIDFLSKKVQNLAWTVQGNMRQDGTPSPQSIVTPSETGDKTANLFNKNTVHDGYYISDTSGIETSSVQYASEANASDYIPVSGDYVSIFSYVTGKWRWGAFYDSSKTFISGISVYNKAIAIPQNAAYMRLTVVDSIMDTLMVNLGSTAQPYEPFGYKLTITDNGITYPVYLSEPIRKIGDYADAASATGTTGTVTRRIKKLVLDKNFSIQKGNDNPTDYNYYFWFSTNSLPAAVAGETTSIRAIITHLKHGYYSPETGAISGNGNVFYLNFGADIMNAQTSGNTVAGLKEYLAAQYAAGTPVCVWYVLAEPETETFAAPTIATAKGENTLTVDTTLPPSAVSVTGNIKPL